MRDKQHTVGRVIILSEICKGCGLCIPACPKGLLALEKNFNEQGFHPAYLVSENGCTGCALCAVSCPDLSIEVFKKVKSSKLKVKS